MQLYDLDSEVVTRTMQLIGGLSTSSSSSLKLSSFNFLFSIDFRYGRNSVTADRTANGIVIHVSGAQIIGYYTQVMPQFPKF